MELTNLSILIFAIFLGLGIYFMYRVFKERTKLNITLLVLWFIIVVFQPIKFTKDDKIELTKKSFNSAIKEEKEIIKSVDQRIYSSDREKSKQEALESFNKQKGE